MKAAIDKIRGALSTKDLVHHTTHYLFKQGMVYATDGRLVAAAPCEFDHDDVLVPGKQLEVLLDRLPTPARVSLSEGTLSLRSGRLHGKVQTLSGEDVSYPAPEGEWDTPPKELYDALVMVRPFISDNATQAWAMGACLNTDTILATTNVVLASAACPGLGGTLQNLPIWVIDFVLSRGSEDLEGILLTDDHVSFKWGDGSWVRSQLLVDKFPDSALALLDEHFTAPKVKIPREWLEATQLLLEVADGEILVAADITIVETELSSVTAEIPYKAIKQDTCWTGSYLAAVLKIATHWDPNNYPNPVSFKGAGIHGLIIGRKPSHARDK